MRNPFGWKDELYMDVESGDLVMFRTHWNVCFGWALWKWWKDGGYLVLRKARLCLPIWHFMWMEKEGGDLYHFVPVNEETRIPWPVFKGRIKKGEWAAMTNANDRVYRKITGNYSKVHYISHDEYIREF